MENQINQVAKELRIFVQTTSSIGDKNNAKYLEERISEEITNVISNAAIEGRSKVFNMGVILGMAIGLLIGATIFLQWVL